MSSIEDGESINGETTENKRLCSRKSRNMSEKKRRDAFNKLILELASMVACGERKLDKSNVLKQTIAYLKAHNQTKSVDTQSHLPDRWKPTFLNNIEYAHLMLEGLNAGIIVLSTSGLVLFSSENIAHVCYYSSGIKRQNLKGLSFFDLLTHESAVEIQRFLSTEVLRAVGNSQENTSQGNANTQTLMVYLKPRLTDSKSDIKLKLVGKFKRVEFSEEDIPNVNNLGAALHPSNETLCFVCIARPVYLREGFATNHNLMPKILAEKLEFTATFNLEWKFAGLDNRAVYIIGYHPFELLGNSGYDYYHYEDLETIAADHRELMAKGRCTSGPYRFLTKSHQWLWLHSVAYITYHQWNSKPEFIVCTCRVVSDPNHTTALPITQPAILPKMEAADVSSTSNLSALLSAGKHSKSQPDLARPPSVKVLRPAPGVSIEHSPIPSPRPKVCKKSSSVSSVPSPAQAQPPAAAQEVDPSAIANWDPSERRIFEELQRTVVTLQQQMLHEQQELRQMLTQNQQFSPRPQLNSPQNVLYHQPQPGPPIRPPNNFRPDNNSYN